ncbi:MAG TPA: exonuclease domain-containing protein [Candidatus Obscuribacterales bacterium]
MSIQVNPLAVTSAPLTKSLSDTVFVAFDTETTGLSPVACRLVEISGVKFRLDRAEIDTFQALINPEVPIPPGAAAVHGITDRMVEKERTYDQVVPDFIAWATAEDPNLPASPGNQTVLIAHNAPFDIGFLEVALCKLNLPMPANLVLDTLPLARQLLTDVMNYQLKTLVEHLKIDAATYHRALADSYHVRNLFLRMVDTLPAGSTLERLVELSGKLHFFDRSQTEEDDRWTNDPQFTAIKQAIADGANLRIFYSGVRKTERIVTPRSVLFTGGNPYLSAFCHLASAERTFRIDKIMKMEMLDK